MYFAESAVPIMAKLGSSPFGDMWVYIGTNLAPFRGIWSRKYTLEQLTLITKITKGPFYAFSMSLDMKGKLEKQQFTILWSYVHFKYTWFVLRYFVTGVFPDQRFLCSYITKYMYALKQFSKNVTKALKHINNQNNCNKAIIDGKYLAPPHASAWQRSPH